MTTKPVNVGLIGYGFSVKCFHLPYLVSNPRVKIHAFLQRAPAPESKIPSTSFTHCTVDFPQAKHYRTSDEFFADKDLELVIVCSQHDTHAEFAEKAMLAGKDVVVEKPFTRSSEEADRVIATAEKTGRRLTVFQNRRWDSDFQTLRSVITSGCLGPILEFENHYDLEFPSWMRGWTKRNYSPGNGMLFGIGTHTIDGALVLFGRPTSVTAFLRGVRGVESEVEDSFTIILQYSVDRTAKGEADADKTLLVTIKTNACSMMKDQVRGYVRGREGSFFKYGTDPQELYIMGGGKATDPGFGEEDESLYGLLATNQQAEAYAKYQTLDERSKKYIGKVPSKVGNYGGFYEDVLDVLEGKKAKFEVDPRTARDGIRIVELARESHEKGVTVPWRD